MGADVVQLLLSAGTIVGLFGYIGHSVYSGYKEFKKDTYIKLEQKVSKGECHEYREYERRDRAEKEYRGIDRRRNEK